MTQSVLIFLIIIIVTASGCAKLAHLNQLLTLKAVTDEQASVGKEVEKKNADFDMLLAMVRSGDISRYKDKKSVAGHFGVPILTRERTEIGIKIEEWVYRYQTQFFNSPKVYLQFDEGNQLIKSFVVDSK